MRYIKVAYVSFLSIVTAFINQNVLDRNIHHELISLEKNGDGIFISECSPKNANEDKGANKGATLFDRLLPPFSKRRDDKPFYQFGSRPRFEGPNANGELTWYPIGFSDDFNETPQRITIRGVNYVVWKYAEQYYSIRDCCSHQGSSFLLGTTCKNTITCPYHGYIFDGVNGDLVDIPMLPHMYSHSHNIEAFKVVEKGSMVYLNTVPIVKGLQGPYNEEGREEPDENRIFVEPEFTDADNRVVHLHADFEHYAKFVSVNSLDICHIGFVHSFGNPMSPNPTNHSKIHKMHDVDNHYKIIYEYLAGKNSIVNKIYEYNSIQVENEYALPHSTVARVRFGPLSSTIITHALPISKFKTRLFVKAYRSYWTHDLTDPKNHNMFYPFMWLVNEIGDAITKDTMIKTLKEDKAIIDLLDKSSYDSMHGKFSIAYDAFSNHYKNQYKTFYETGPNEI
jgi:phenylpropionate dioxygenase-like ring-hydroxylating dioxygenase large terminal subunit